MSQSPGESLMSQSPGESLMSQSPGEQLGLELLEPPHCTEPVQNLFEA